MLLAKVRGEDLEQYEVFLSSIYLAPTDDQRGVVMVGCKKVNKDRSGKDFFEGVKARDFEESLRFLYPVVRAIVRLGYQEGKRTDKMAGEINRMTRWSIGTSIRSEEDDIPMELGKDKEKARLGPGGTVVTPMGVLRGP